MSHIKTTITINKLPPGFFSAFKTQAQLKATDYTIELAKEVCAEAKEIIRKQVYNWKPLSEKYAKWKKAHSWDGKKFNLISEYGGTSLDPRIYMATKTFVNKGIGWWIEGGRIFVGPKKGIHRPSGLSYRVLARILEFGTNTIPARPIWRPLLSSMMRKKKLFRDKYYKAMHEAMKVKLEHKVITV